MPVPAPPARYPPCKDRLPDLRRRCAAGGAGGAPECPPATPPSHPPTLAHVLQETERIRAWIAEVRSGTQCARALLAHPAFHTNKDVQEQLDSVVTQCNAAGLKVCGALRQLEAQGGGGGGAGAGGGEGRERALAGRVARLQAACCRRAYALALSEHHALLAAAREQQLQLLRHHAHIVNMELSEEECQSLLDSDSMALFVDNVRTETAAARLALRDVEARHLELRRVEAALGEVRALFLQLGALVAAQQEHIDTVQHFALSATEYVGDGQVQLHKGVVLKRKSRKKQMGLIICLATGVLIVLVILIFT